MQATHVTIWPGDEPGLDDDDGGDGDDDGDGSDNDDDGNDEDGDSDDQSGHAGCTRNCLTWVRPKPEFHSLGQCDIAGERSLAQLVPWDCHAWTCLDWPPAFYWDMDEGNSAINLLGVHCTLFLGNWEQSN